MELLAESGRLSVVLVSKPRLKNDLKRPTVEVGDRTTVFEFGGLRNQQREYIVWRSPSASRTVQTSLTSSTLRRSPSSPRGSVPAADRALPCLAFEAGFAAGVKPVSLGILDGVLSTRIDDEPELTRHATATTQ